MTVKEFKEILERLPDDYEVLIPKEGQLTQACIASVAFAHFGVGGSVIIDHELRSNYDI